MLSAATSSGAFGEAVTLFPADGDAYEIRGVFDDDHREIATEFDTPLSTTGPMLCVRVSALQHDLAVDDELEVRGRRFAVVDIQPDGQGTLELPLNLLEPAGGDE
ncbi:MAG: hypothetical protein AAFU73_23005 [Planctomycetota bacterium]